MKATPLIINWHDQHAPIYSAHFEPNAKGRLATAAGDNNVRLWKIDAQGNGDNDNRQAEYLTTLSKHTQAVNVVRWAPKGELLASAGDDGNVILWLQSDYHHSSRHFGSDGLEDKESWRAKNMCRSSGAEIYDLAWSPDSVYFIIGSMDNIARIYSAATGTLVRQIAEHSHYVQGVAWDPLNEFIATQSSDRSVHIYSLRTKDGQYALASHDDKPPKIASHVRADLPTRRISSHSPAPPDLGYRSLLSAVDAGSGSPLPSVPGTPTSIAVPVNPLSVISHSRRSSFSSRRSASPAPSMPLPAVMPMEASPKFHPTSASHATTKNTSLYANETLTSFFRRLTFTPDGSLLLTPAGQYQLQHQAAEPGGKTIHENINTVFMYTRGGINKPPVAHLPGHKKPSVVVRCSPILYTLRTAQATPTKNFTIDTSSAEDPMAPLPEPVSKPPATPLVMEPPPPPTSADTGHSAKGHLSSSASSSSGGTDSPLAKDAGPKPVIALPYRIIYAVATQDSVLVYDTQQQTPIWAVSNLHLATFTDLAWSNDGLTLVIASSDGFCSTLTFEPSDFGEVHKGEVQPTTTSGKHGSLPAGFSSNQSTPHHHHHHPASYPHRNSVSSMTAPSPPPIQFAHPPPTSPAPSNSASSVGTPASMAPSAMSSGPTLIAGHVPSIMASSSTSKVMGMPVTTPPTTPHSSFVNASSATHKRDVSESEQEDTGQVKKRRVNPTLLRAPTSDHESKEGST